MKCGQKTWRKTLLSSAVSMAMFSLPVPIALAQTEAGELALTVVESDTLERDAVIEVLGVEDMNAIQVDNFQDLVRYTPNVTVARGDTRWGNSGFNIRGLDQDRVAMNVDGVPQGETLKYESGQAYGYFKGSRNGVEIETLKSVEIVKGADSILSGSGALAGAVNMTTKDPADFLSAEGDDLGASVKTTYASGNEEGMVSLAAAGRKGIVEALLIYTRREGHEFRNYNMDGLDIDGSAREVPDPQDIDQDSLLAKVVVEPTRGHRFGVVFDHYERNMFTDSRSFNGGWYANRVGDDTRETQRVGLFHELEKETLLFDRISTALNHQEVNFNARTLQRVNIVIPPFFSNVEDRVDTRRFDQELLQLTVDLEKSFGEHSLLYGFDYRDREHQNTQYRSADNLLNDDDEWVTSNIGALVPRADSDIWTAYGLAMLSLTDSTRVRAGLRYDSYDYNAQSDENYLDTTGTLQPVTFDAVTWTLGIEQQLTAAWSLEAGVSTGFRAPTIEEMYSTSGALDDWDEVANPDLEAESSLNYDVALVGNIGPASLRLGAFYSQYDDFVEYLQEDGINSNTGQPDLNGYLIPRNTDEVTMKGLEFSASVDLSAALDITPGLSTGIQAAYTDGEHRNGDPVYTVQPMNIVWRLAYQQPAGRWGGELLANYTAAKDASDAFDTNIDGERIYPDYLSNASTTFDLQVYMDVLENLRITAGIYNLTDKEYYAWDSIRFIDQGDLRPGIGVTGDGIRRYSEPERNVQLTLNYRF